MAERVNGVEDIFRDRKVFKDVAGMSPAEYRRLNGKETDESGRSGEKLSM